LEFAPPDLVHSGVLGTDDFRMRYSTERPLLGVFGRPRRRVHRIELSPLLVLLVLLLIAMNVVMLLFIVDTVAVDDELPVTAAWLVDDELVCTVDVHMLMLPAWLLLLTPDAFVCFLRCFSQQANDFEETFDELDEDETVLEELLDDDEDEFEAEEDDKRSCSPTRAELAVAAVAAAEDDCLLLLVVDEAELKQLPLMIGSLAVSCRLDDAAAAIGIAFTY